MERYEQQLIMFERMRRAVAIVVIVVAAWFGARTGILGSEIQMSVQTAEAAIAASTDGGLARVILESGG